MASARTFRPESPIARNPDALWRAYGREVAILSRDSSAVRTLAEAGARLWELADGRPLVEIVDALVVEYDVERATLERDLVELLGELDARGLLAPEAR